VIQSVSQLNHSHQGQRLRLVLLSGEIAEVESIEVALRNKYDKTRESWGIVYDLISSNRPRPAPKGAAFRTRLDDMQSFEVLEKEAS
jgi:hypothetical protein